jgi:peroxiredoxin Q/BCP
MLAPGDQAPDFTLPSTSGGEVSLKALRGQKVVLYFYPKDNTPGCTTEACDFRDHNGRLAALGAVVLGVSKDSLTSHAKFRDKFHLAFDLLSDADNHVAKAYGAHGQKMMYGKPVIGTIRSTFVIDEHGKVLARWSPVKVAGHVEDVVAVLSGGGSASVAQAAPGKKPARSGGRKPSGGGKTRGKAARRVKPTSRARRAR